MDLKRRQRVFEENQVANQVVRIGINLSEASILNFNKEGYSKLEPFENSVKECLIKADVIHNDESGGRYEKKLGWFQVASTELLTFFYFHRNRGSKAMDEMEILPKFKGKSMHDFFKPYFKYACEHLLCNAHLLRELIFDAEENLQLWAKDMITLLLKIKEDVDNAKLLANSNSLSKEMLLTLSKMSSSETLLSLITLSSYNIFDFIKKDSIQSANKLVNEILNFSESFSSFPYKYPVCEELEMLLCRLLYT